MGEVSAREHMLVVKGLKLITTYVTQTAHTLPHTAKHSSLHLLNLSDKESSRSILTLNS